MTIPASQLFYDDDDKDDATAKSDADDAGAAGDDTAKYDGDNDDDDDDDDDEFSLLTQVSIKFSGLHLTFMPVDRTILPLTCLQIKRVYVQECIGILVRYY